MSRDNFTKWLYFGLHIKRWLLLIMVAVAVMGLGFAYLLREVYVSYTFPGWVEYATLQFIPRWARGALFISVASGLTVFSAWKLNQSIALAVLPPSTRPNDVVDMVYRNRTRDRGPKIVAIGGGTGLSNLLRGLKQYSSNLTAVVTVADDGGSSGRLRQNMQVIPPGDIRNCIAALADAEPLVTELFQYRFDDRAGEGMAGHSFGNLFITAMAEVTGSVERGIEETSRVLAVRGHIVPSSLEDVALVARFADGREVRGESAIPASGEPPVEVRLEPRDIEAHPNAVAAIRDADLVIIGPGSLYTSVLPNLLVKGIAKALAETQAYRVYISNVATQHGETDGYSAADHYGAIRRHLPGATVVDAVLANSNLPQQPLPAEWQSTPVLAPGDADYHGARLLLADLVDHEKRYRHNTEALASALMRAYFERDLRSRALLDPIPQVEAEPLAHA
ncbi:MAG: YvcK family protein [Dehalococcoidia bacterium]|nr:YvcK family protein [Dehalococcoidia bacterium]